MAVAESTKSARHAATSSGDLGDAEGGDETQGERWPCMNSHLERRRVRFTYKPNRTPLEPVFRFNTESRTFGKTTVAHYVGWRTEMVSASITQAALKTRQLPFWHGIWKSGSDRKAIHRNGKRAVSRSGRY